MARGFDAVKYEIANQMEFPARRIMQGVGARIAPITIEVVCAKHRPGSGQLKQFAAREQGNFCRQHLGLGDHYRGSGDAVFGRLGQSVIHCVAGFFQDRFSAVQSPFQIANRSDGERVLPAVFLWLSIHGRAWRA